MEPNRTNAVSNDSRISSGLSSPARSDLAAASDARIEAARQALNGAAIAPPARLAQVDYNVAQGAWPTVANVQSRAIPPQPSARELAAMAADVYAPGQAVPEGWAIASSQQLEAIGLMDSMLTSAQSEFRAEVYVNEIAGQLSYVVAFRGTQSASDWGANLKQGVGLRTDHYNRALEIGERLITPVGARVTITGHSLGGGLASAASLAAEIGAVTFNAAGLADRTINRALQIAGADGRIDTPDISAFHVRGEILSTLQDGGDRMLAVLLGTGYLGAALLDMPEAVGTQISLDPIRPETMRWHQDSAVAQHMMDYVISSLAGS